MFATRRRRVKLIPRFPLLLLATSAVAWCLSYFFALAFVIGSSGVGFEHSELVIWWNKDTVDTGISWNRTEPALDLLPIGSNVLSVPLATAILPATIWILISFALKSAVRHEQEPRCRCGYSLVGNTSERCPECGEPANGVDTES
jgi:hypothetical protein